MPAGQVCRHVGSEADERLWVKVRGALEQGLTLMPPDAQRRSRTSLPFDDVRARSTPTAR